MAFGLSTLRSVDWLRGWSLRRSLQDPQTSKPALARALKSIPGNTALAIDVLCSKVVSQADRIKVLSALLTSSEVVRAGKVSAHPHHLPPAAPRFFSSLALRSEQIVSGINAFWSHFDGEAKLALTGHTVKSALQGNNLNRLFICEYRDGTGTIYPDHNQIVGYQIGQHKFYLRSGPIEPCSWAQGDVTVAFDLASLHRSLKDNLVGVRSEGFYSQTDIYECAKAMAGYDKDMPKIVQDAFGPGSAYYLDKPPNFF